MVYRGASLADGQVGSVKGTLYTVPAGFSCVIRSAIFFNTNAVSQTVNVYVKRSGSNSRQIYRLSLGQYYTAEILDDANMLTLSEGDVIEADTTTMLAVDYFISGAVE